MRRFVPATLILVVSLPAFALCTIDLQSAGHTVTWAVVPGANDYTIEYSSNAFATTTRVPLGSIATFFDLPRTASDPVGYSFRVTAISTKDPNFRCTGTATRLLPNDVSFRQAMERAIIPVVATIAGVNGAVFKTSLRLTAQTALTSKGKIIFHPAGCVGTDADPSIPYAFTHDGESIVFDDVVGAFGRVGVGSIDIVPEPGSNVPIAEAHIYHPAANGTFGSFEHQVQPIDFLNPVQVRAYASQQVRVNIGVRTISTSEIHFDLYDNNNEIRVQRALTYPPNYTLLSSPEALLGTALAPGEMLVIYAERGSLAIPFFTYTESGTNDPTLVMPAFPVKATLGPYDVAGVVSVK